MDKHRWCELITRTCTVTEFLIKLKDGLISLLPHVYIARQQALFLNEAKKNVNDENAVVLVDFSENYNFIVQDEVQGFH